MQPTHAAAAALDRPGCKGGDAAGKNVPLHRPGHALVGATPSLKGTAARHLEPSLKGTATRHLERMHAHLAASSAQRATLSAVQRDPSVADQVDSALAHYQRAAQPAACRVGRQA